jgi:threonine/homoserine/homoserine lactone efflux protein
MLDTIFPLLLAALPLMGSPGPANLSLAAAGSAFGMGKSLKFQLGVIAGTASVLVLVAAGVGAVILALPGAAPILALAATCYILYLAYRIATAPILSEPSPSQAPPSAAGGYFLAVANPKAYTALGSLAAGHRVVTASAALDAVAKIGILSLVIVLVTTIWLLLGTSFATLLRRPRIGRAANIVFACLLVLSVAAALAH